MHPDSARRLARRRIRIRLDSEGYADERAAVEDAARIAAFVAAPASHREYSLARQAHLDEVDPRPARAPARPQRLATTVHEVLLVTALLLGLGAVALTLPGVSTGRAAFRLDPGLLWSGILALACLGLYAAAEPYRRSSRVHSLRVATTGILLFMAIAWTLVCVLSLLTWHGVPGDSVAAPTGLLLLVLAITGSVVLWVRGRRTDRLLAEQSRRTFQLDPPARERYLAAMDRWWKEFAASLSTEQADLASTAFDSALAQLRTNGFLTSSTAAGAAKRPVASVLREQRW